MKQKFDIRTLEKSKLEASFNPPDNYVDNFTTRLMQQIPAEAVQPGASSPVSPRRRLYLRLKVGLGVAAVMGGVAFCLFAGLRHHTPATQPQMSAQQAFCLFLRKADCARTAGTFAHLLVERALLAFQLLKQGEKLRGLQGRDAGLAGDEVFLRPLELLW